MKHFYTFMLTVACIATSKAQAQYDECTQAGSLIMYDIYNSMSFDAVNNTLSTNAENCSAAQGVDLWFSTNPQYSTLPIHFSDNVIGYSVYSSSCIEDQQICQDPLTPGVNYLKNLIPGENIKIRIYVQPNGAESNPGYIWLGYPNTSFSMYIDSNLFTDEELATKVLQRNGSCLGISNVTSSTGTDFGSVNGIGYFDRNGTNFPFNRGIILSSGNAESASYNNVNLSEGSAEWLGDADLAALFPSSACKNATSFEFDFIALGTQLSLEYLFASEEYGPTQCIDPTDHFAILLTDIVAGTTTNLGVIPGTNIPVSPLTVRDNSMNSSCASQNPEYFGYNFNAQQYPQAVDFNGGTVPLTAEATLIPGHQYHIKFVVADFFHTLDDSALFINAESMNFSPDINNYHINTLDMYYCASNPNLLSTDYGSEYNLQWYLNGSLIENATESSYIPTSPGIYTLSVTLPGDDCSMEFSREISPLDLTTQAPTNYYEYDTDADGYTTVNIPEITDYIMTLNGFDPDLHTVQLYSTEALAAEGVTSYALGAFEPYVNVSNPVTLYARTAYFFANCYEVTPVSLNILQPGAPAPPPIADAEQPYTDQMTLADFAVDGQNIEWFADAEGTIPLPPDTIVELGVTYYSTLRIGNQRSATVPVTAVSETSGIQEGVLKNVTIYPNPAHSQLNITSASALNRAELYTILGQQVITKELNSTGTTLDIQNLQAGVYLLKVYSGNSSTTLRVIKK